MTYLVKKSRESIVGGTVIVSITNNISKSSLFINNRWLGELNGV